VPLLRNRSGKGLPTELEWEPNVPTTSDDYAAAERKAQELLRHHLSKDQLAQFSREGNIYVTGSLGGKYCIRLRGSSCSIDGERCSYCVYAYGYNGYPAHYVPSDSALAMLLLLRTNEQAFLNEAVPYTGLHNPFHLIYDDPAVVTVYREAIRRLGPF